MIVTLTSLVGNWQRELAALRADADGRGPSRRRSPRASRRARRATTSIITTYPLVARDRDELAEMPLHMLVLDEAHAIKNRDAQASEAVRALDARHRVCLIGHADREPPRRAVGAVRLLQSRACSAARKSSRCSSAQPIEERGDKVRLEALRDRVRPFILRRTKDAVAPELPREDAARARGRAHRRAARALREHPRRRARRGPPAHPPARLRGVARSRSSTRCSSCARSAAIRGSSPSTPRATSREREARRAARAARPAARRRPPHPRVLAVRAHARPDLRGAARARHRPRRR